MLKLKVAVLQFVVSLYQFVAKYRTLTRVHKENMQVVSEQGGLIINESKSFETAVIDSPKKRRFLSKKERSKIV